MNNKKIVSIIITIFAIGLLLGTMIAHAVNPTSTFYLSSGIYPGAPSYTIWREGSYYYAKNVYGKIDFSGTDAVTVIHQARDALTVKGKILLEKGIYESANWPIVINDDNIVLEGEVCDRKQEYFTDPPTPLARVTEGTVLKVTTADVDAIQVTGERYGVCIKHLAIDFTQSSTGHGINCIANNEVGLSEFAIEDIFVNNCDGSHYALRMENGVLGTVDRLTCFGGGLLELVSEDTAKGTFNSGNIVFRQISGWVCKDLATHAVYIHRGSGAGWSNLYLFDRLFVITASYADMGAYSGLWAEWLHHSQFNMLNIECWLCLVDVVHLAEVHDITFVNPYIMYNPSGGWYAHSDCDLIRVFGGVVDLTISDRGVKDVWFGTAVHAVDEYNQAEIIDCFVYNGTVFLPTNVRSSIQGTSPITVTHGLITTPLWILITPAGYVGDFYYDNATETTFKIYFTGGGTGFFCWSAGCYQQP